MFPFRPSIIGLFGMLLQTHAPEKTMCPFEMRNKKLRIRFLFSTECFEVLPHVLKSCPGIENQSANCETSKRTLHVTVLLFLSYPTQSMTTSCSSDGDLSWQTKKKTYDEVERYHCTTSIYNCFKITKDFNARKRADATAEGSP